DTLRRWTRRVRDLPPNPYSNEMPKLEDLISGDLIAGAVLAVILAVLFSQPVAYVLAGLAQVRDPITLCTVSPPRAFPSPGPPPDAPATFSFIDTLVSPPLLL